MISLTVTPESSKRLYVEIQNKIDGMKELKSVQTKNELISTAFSISALKFVSKTNMLARSAKKSFHHVYEWDSVGKESGRLFRIIKKQNTGGSASIYYRFNNSKKNSPIASALKVPGPTGKVVTRSGIFKKKAEVMESGQSVNFITSRYIAFSPKGGGLVFVPPGRTINIKSPGGSATTGSFEKHFKIWWTTHFQTSLDEKGIFSKLEKNVARALNKKNAGRSAAKIAILDTLKSYQKIGSII